MKVARIEIGKLRLHKGDRVLIKESQDHVSFIGLVTYLESSVDGFEIHIVDRFHQKWIIAPRDIERVFPQGGRYIGVNE